MQSAFLKSLKGKTVREAEDLVRESDYMPYFVAEGATAIPSMAMTNTVVLWQRGGRVFRAVAGDPTEIE